MNRTPIVLTALIFISFGCSSTPKQQQAVIKADTVISGEIDERDDVLLRLGTGVRTIALEGRLSTTGAQTMNRMPFNAVMNENDHFQLTMGGPFGMTAAKMYARPDTFVMVNYLMQQVWDGDPRSPTLKTATHLPLPAADLLILMRGRAPGNVDRFTRESIRDDGTILFRSKGASRVEYLLVDPEKNLLRQYQVKNVEGEVELDMAFLDVRVIDGVHLPHEIRMATQNRTQTATVEVTSMTINKAITEPLQITIPSSYERVTFH